MTPADRRINELIEKWLTSIDLHLKHVELNDAAYARVQAWPKHERPTRWVLEVARQKILELKAQCEARQDMGDGKFSESLELMAFLANLVGIQHIQRFVPLAEPGRAQTSTGTTQTVEAPAIRTGTQRMRAPEEATREMPRLRVAPPKVTSPAAAPKVASAAPVAKTEERKLPAKAPPTSAKPVPANKAALNADMRGKIIADAVRLTKWGKSWHELAETIERIADRPPASEIRKLLRTHKAEIESKAAKAAK
jgi:hypothetical protein